MPNPAIAGGKRPPHHSKQVVTHPNGVKEDISGVVSYILRKGQTLACYCQGGCGVGNPLDREIKSVRRDVIDEIVSLESARDIYGVVINPETLEVDKVLTEKLRIKKRKPIKQRKNLIQEMNKEVVPIEHIIQDRL